MNKERLKSVVLIILVAFNFVLGNRILTDKKLWPSGYNFFITSEKGFLHSLFSSEAEEESKQLHLTAPTQIIVNTGDQTTRFVVNPDSEQFEPLFTYISETVTSAFRSGAENVFSVSLQDWYSVLNGKSVYFMYPFAYPSTLYAQFLGIETANLPIESVCRFAVTTSGNANVYLEDYKSGKVYRIETKENAEPISALLSRIQSSNSSDSPIINYSFDLRFDQTLGSQKIVLAPTVPVYTVSPKTPRISAKNPLSDIDRETVEAILLAFRMNPGGVREYPEVSGTRVFVDNAGILKISPDGLLTYQSTRSEGLSLSAGASQAEAISAAADFGYRITSICQAERSIYLSGIPGADTPNISFDYCTKGIPVLFEDERSPHAIEIQLENGALKSYTQRLRTYQPIYMQTAPGYIETLDKAIASYAEAMNEVKIQNIYLSYTDRPKASELSADWYVEVENIIVEEEEQ